MVKPGSDALNTIDYVTIASTENACRLWRFNQCIETNSAAGDSISCNWRLAVSPISGPFAANNVMDFFTIASSGNGLNFGDLKEDLIMEIQLHLVSEVCFPACQT